MASTTAVQNKQNVLAISAWIFMLLASILPEIILNDLIAQPDLLPWVDWVRLVTLAVLVVITLVWQPVRPLWKYATILLIIAASQMAMDGLENATFWQNGVNSISNPLARELLGVQFWKIGVTFITICGLFFLNYRRTEAFLVRGQIDAPITPVKWLGFPKPEPWTHFGAKWIVFLSLGTMVLLFIFGAANFQNLFTALGMMPLILLLSTLNAFNEEVVYRSAQLAPLEPAVGTYQALWITAVLFAVMHFYSAIGGIAGVTLTIFMGWMLTKAMLETRGFFWSWLIHFTQDVIIFWFIAAGAAS